MSVLLTVAVVLVLVFLGVSLYGRLTALRERVRKAWRQLETERTRRHDVVTALVKAVRETTPLTAALDTVVAAGDQAASARGPIEAAAKERTFIRAIEGLLTAVAPDMLVRTNPDVQRLRQDLAAADGRVARAAGAYNDLAARYNALAHSLPGSLVTGFGSFPVAEKFEGPAP